MTQRQKKQVEKIKKTLSSQTFYNFYKDGGEYDDYISNKFSVSREERKKFENFIDEKIVELFDLK